MLRIWELDILNALWIQMDVLASGGTSIQIFGGQEKIFRGAKKYKMRVKLNKI